MHPNVQPRQSDFDSTAALRVGVRLCSIVTIANEVNPFGNVVFERSPAKLPFSFLRKIAGFLSVLPIAMDKRINRGRCYIANFAPGAADRSARLRGRWL